MRGILKRKSQAGKCILKFAAAWVMTIAVAAGSLCGVALPKAEAAGIALIRSVSPSYSMSVTGYTVITLSAWARTGSTVTVKLSNKTMKMTVSGSGDDQGADSAFSNYVTTFKAPAPNAKWNQVLGQPVFTAKYGKYSVSVKGGKIMVVRKGSVPSANAMTGKTYTHAVINRQYAYTYPYMTTPSYPQGILSWLPYGTEDAVTSINGNFVNLHSGITVNKSQVYFINKVFKGSNAITNMSLSQDDNYTEIRLAMKWRSPFSINLSPYPTAPTAGTGYVFSADTAYIMLNYVTACSSISGNLDQSPIFSGTPQRSIVKNSQGVYQYKLTLPLREVGRYYGCHTSWDGNTLVLKFNNPPKSADSLEGKTIVVDAGHGGYDNGTMAGAQITEKEANLVMANKVADALRSRGATVIMTRWDDTFVSLAKRVDIANYYNADMFIACHHNSGNAATSGEEVYYNTPFSMPLAYYISQELGAYSTNRGARGPEPSYNFFVTREKQYPSVLVEFGYLSNAEDEAAALDETHQSESADAVAQAVVDYYAAYNDQ